MPGTTSKKNHEIDAEFADLDIFRNASPVAGSLNVDLELRGALNEAIRKSGKIREQIIKEIEDLTGVKVNVHTLNAWTAPSKSKSSRNTDQNNNKRWGIPAEMIAAICHVTGDNRSLALLVEKIGLKLMSREQQAALRVIELKDRKRKLTQELKLAEELSRRVRG